VKIRAFGKTDIGLKRKINQDMYLIAPELDLYVIADGMGGHKAGEVASRLAVNTMASYWRKLKEGKPPSFLFSTRKDLSNTANHLVNSIMMSNAIIHEAQKKPQYHRMGSTVSALIQENDTLWVANVGDSPIYLFDNGRLVQISEEHSVEAEQRSMGMTNPDGTTNPFLKNVLTRVLGLTSKVNVYINSIRPEPGDMILMCSDGLTNYVPLDSIAAVLSDSSVPAEQKVNMLVEQAIKGGGGDNITVVLLEVLKEGKWHKLRRRIMSR